MDPADVRHLDDRAAGWRLCCPCERRILVQGEMRPPLVIIGQEELEGASEGSLVPHDHVIETLSPQGPDQALDEGILPGTARRGLDFLGPKTLQQTTEVGSVAAVANAQ